MGKPVNLNRFRKEKARADKKARADQNSVKFGRTKEEKDLGKATKRLGKDRLDGHKLDE